MLSPRMHPLTGKGKNFARSVLVVNVFGVTFITMAATRALVPLVGEALSALLYLVLFLAVAVMAVALLERHIGAVIAAEQAERVRDHLEELQVLPVADDADHDPEAVRQVALQELGALARSARSGDE